MDLQSKKMRYFLVGLFFLAMLTVALYIHYSVLAITSLTGEELLILRVVSESRTNSRVH